MKIARTMLLAVIFAFSGPNISAQWNNICQFNTTMNDIWFTDDYTGFAGGGETNAKLMKTTDGGYTWNDITPIEFTGPIYAMNFRTPTTGFLSWRDNNWSNTYLERTLDAGATWTVQYNTVPSIHAICFPTSQVGYCFPNAMEYIDVVKTIDGGISWQRIDFYVAEEPVLGVKDCFFTDEMTGYLVTGNGSVFKTTDGGFNMNRIHYDPAFVLTGVTFTSPEKGYITGYRDGCWESDCGLLLKTTDAGATWEEMIPNDYCYDICFIDADTGYLGTYGILKTTDGGSTWYADTCNYYGMVSKIFFAGNKIGYALASFPGGTAIMKRDPDIGVSVRLQTGIPSFTISPVPAKEDLTITLNLKEPSTIAIDIVDHQGKIVYNLTDEIFPAGTRIFHKDISSLPEGFYLCRFHSGKGSITQKLLITR